jgi:hypothetical protein
MTTMRYIAVNNDHGWGKGETAVDARQRSLVNGRKATLVRIWEIADGKGDDAYVDGMGTVYGIKPETRTDYRRAPNGRKWTETPYDPEA